MPIQNLNGGKTYPKRGRLGSGAYWPAGVPIAGNIFGPNTQVAMTPTPPASRPFGSPGNAGNNTQFGQNRVTSGAGFVNPNVGQNPVAQQNKTPPFTRDGSGNELSPFGANPVIQPHERNRLPHKKIFGHYRTVSGASRTLPSDTAFHRVPPKERAPVPPQPQNYTLQQTRNGGVASFSSRNNLWVDPNNSFQGGVVNPIAGGVGRGRWSTIKKGAAG